MGKVAKISLRNKQALHFKDRSKGDKSAADSDDEDEYKYADEGTYAQRVVRQIYQRWQAQLKRWADYRNLFLFLAFIALYLGVLYAQRNAHISYQVHSTIQNVVLPAATTLNGIGDVYAWLQGLLTTIWVDPVCGDGLCEAPFEFASYGRFGCRADCGKLSEVQNLTTIQVDLYYDFSHPLGSLPASELMSQASWNLCPVSIAYNSDCYYDKDQTFTSLQGEVHVSISDAPDGQWDLQIKRDLFNKIRGAVRSTPLLNRAAYYAKIFTAAAAVNAEQQYELGLLRSAITVANTPFFSYLPTMWNNTNQAYRDAFDRQQMINTTCVCGGTSMLVGTAGFNNATWQSTNCSGITMVLDRTYDAQGNATIVVPADATAQASICTTALANLTTHYNAFNATLLSLLVGQRIGNLRDTGKFAVRNKVFTQVQTYVQANNPELVAAIFTNPRGANALDSPQDATLTALANLYVDSPQYVVTGAPANLALYRRRLTLDVPMVTVLQYAVRAQARIDEIAAQQAAVAALNVPGPAGALTLSSLVANFNASGGNETVLPASSKLTPPLQVNYDLVTWQGNTTAYLSCSLSQRAPQYVGKCEDITTRCILSGIDTQPYNCTKLSTNTTIAGNISAAVYRESCELPCDRQYDCSAICECYGTCGSNQICVCDACEKLAQDAKTDSEFITIQGAVQTSAASSAVIADTSTTVSVGRRRLMQANSTAIQEELAKVLSSVTDLKTSQTSISTQMSTLQNQVDRANLLAAARASDTRVLDLITAGRSDIQAGQASIEKKLDILINKQQQALDAMNTAANQLAAIQGLATQQTQALSNLDVAVKTQLSTISVATQNGLINLYQALSLWKRARRDRALAIKGSKLANSPCQSQPINDNEFEVSNGNNAANSTARDRTIGLNNRVIAGMLLHTWRTKDKRCPSSRFDKIQATCSGGADLAPYGVDPVFKPGTQSYNPDLNDPQGQIVQTFYNCSLISNPTYDVVDPATNLTGNPRPYCAELYNPRSVPYAFRHFPLKELPLGYPVWFDINLSQDGAQTWYTWVNEGLFMDDHTRGVEARMVTYNAELKVFANIKLSFEFGDGGSITVTNHIYTLRMELYQTSDDRARYAFEIILTGVVLGMLLLQLFGMARAFLLAPARRKLRAIRVSLSWVDLASNVLMVACAFLWWDFSQNHAKYFSMALRYPVYAWDDLQPQAYFLKLRDNGAQFSGAWDAFQSLERAIGVLNWYYALHGINILLLIARVLRLMHFQPRLGVVTRSLALAAPDLIHFAIVAGAVFIGYAMMGFLIFGNSIEQFNSFGESINTCFEMLLGVLDVNTQLRALGGVQAFAGALFFWSYELLVFMVLLNFLLAIIVDAFSEIKEKTKETTGIHTEIARLIGDKFRSMAALLTRNRISESKLDGLLRQWAGEPAQDDDEDDPGCFGTSKLPNGIDVDDKTLQVLGEELDEGTLKDILLACLDDAAAAAKGESSEGFKGASKANKGPGCLPGAPEPLAATPDDIALAAHYVIKRFGNRPGKGDAKSKEEPAAAAGAGPSTNDEASLAAERDRLAAALERLAEVQRELAEAQRNLMAGQKQLADQQARLVSFVQSEAPSPSK